tara:strand:- start:1493 stop:3022 length:1530 start_codon:yes stop_codon:yes gene_type:complete
MNILDKFFTKFAYKFPKGYPDLKNSNDVLLLESLISKLVEEKFKLFEDTFYDVVGGNKLEDDIFVKLNAGEDFDVNVEDVIFVRGSGKSYTPQSTDKKNNYTLSDIRKIIDEFDKPVYLTYTDNILKLRTPFGVRILQAGVPSKVGSSDFKRLLALNKLKSEYPDKIIVTQKLAAGLGYEKAQVEGMNAVINEVINLTGGEPLELYVDGKPQDVKITGALKRAGSGKADLALVNGEKEVYWISYKEGAYKTGDGTYSKVPFQQYGSLVTLYGKQYDEEMAEFEAYLKSVVPDFLNAIKDKGEKVEVFNNVKYDPKANIKAAEDDNKYFLKSDGNKLDVSDDIKGFWQELAWDKFKKEIGSSTADVVVVKAGANFYDAFVDDNNKNSKILAGKSVYGLEFGEAKENSSENCNMLLQSDGVVDIGIITDGDTDEATGINLQIEGSSGHVLFNPDLPVDKDDAGYPYTPALNLRHTKALSFSYESEGKKIVYLAGRLLIMPVGNLSSATEIN